VPKIRLATGALGIGEKDGADDLLRTRRHRLIGRFLVERLLQREGDIAVLVRASSREKLSEQIERRTATATAATRRARG